MTIAADVNRRVRRAGNLRIYIRGYLLLLAHDLWAHPGPPGPPLPRFHANLLVMTHLAVSIMVRNLQTALAAAARAAEFGADLVEWRIDQFTDDRGAIEQLIARCPLPCILTVRPTWEGGDCSADDEQRFSFLEQAARNAQPPAYIDVELATYQRYDNLRQRIDALFDPDQTPRATDSGLILSAHDFSMRPADLLNKLVTMASPAACRVIKVAWQARSLRDNIEAFQIISQRLKPTIAVCMGDCGLPSRVLAKKFGALLTFASLDASSSTAPGQVNIADMKDLYRWDKIDRNTRVYGVIGFPVGHSMSPPIHNAGFEHVDHNGVYLPMPVPPEYESFKATMCAWLDYAPLHFRGASVTIPHKENLLRFVAQQGGEIEPLARTIGAANTLTVRDDGSLYASNTDYAAVLDAICGGLDIEREQLRGRRVGVIGAGGAARAVVAGFTYYGAEVVIYNRTLDRAQALADQFGASGAAMLAELAGSSCEIFINCTPVGMYPDVDQSPLAGIKGWGPGGPGTVVFDTIYNPMETLLLRQAREAGCMTIPGCEMFVRQAARQFELWTNKPAPLELFAKILEEHLTPPTQDGGSI